MTLNLERLDGIVGGRLDNLTARNALSERLVGFAKRIFSTGM